jgi:hypothetical protein
MLKLYNVMHFLHKINLLHGGYVHLCVCCSLHKTTEQIFMEFDVVIC